jgi:hypothetical protein
MADEGISFAIKFPGDMLAPLKALQGQLTAVETSLKALNATMRENVEASQAAGEAAEGTGESMMSAVFGGELLEHTFEKVIEKAKEMAVEMFHSAIAATDFGYKAHVAFEALTGSVEEGAQAFEEAERTARDLAMPIEGVTRAMLGLRTAHINEEWIRPLVAGAADLAAVKLDPAVFTQVTQAIEMMGLRGEITGRDLRMLATAGISPAVLAAKFGAADFRELQKQLEQKPLGLYQGLRAIEETIKETAHEGTLGDTALRDTQTIEGSIQKIKNDFDIMLTSMNSAGSGPMQQIRGSIASIAEMFDPATAQGQAFEQLLATIAMDVEKVIRSIAENPEAVQHFFESAISDTEKLLSLVEPLFDHIETIAKVARVGWDLTGGLMTGGVLDVGKDIGSLLPHHAAGGIVTQEHTAVVGEVPEAIIPLDQLGDVVPAGGGAGGGIHVSVDVGGVQMHGGGEGEGINEQRLAEMLEEMLVSSLVSPLDKIATTAGAM